jgi:hypothetical protein
MTAAEIIDEIRRLRPEEQAGIVRFVYRLDAERKLSGPELSVLAQRFITAADAEEASRVREKIVRGFYRGKVDA